MQTFRRSCLLTGRVCSNVSDWIAMDDATRNDNRDPGPSGDGPSGYVRPHYAPEALAARAELPTVSDDFPPSSISTTEDTMKMVEYEPNKIPAQR